MNSIIRYFDILSEARGRIEAVGLASVPQWIPQWLALFAGVLIQPYFASYQLTHRWDFAGFSGWVLASLIIATIIFPGLYKNAFDPAKPWIIQIIPIFAGGMGWNTLFATAVAAAGAGHGGTPIPLPTPT